MLPMEENEYTTFNKKWDEKTVLDITIAKELTFIIGNSKIVYT